MIHAILFWLIVILFIEYLGNLYTFIAYNNQL